MTTEAVSYMAGRMPCDGAWPEQSVTRFKAWMAGDFQQ